MNRFKFILLCATLLAASVSAACGGGGSQPQSGFKVKGEKYVQTTGGGFFFVSATGVSGNWQFDNGSAVGNTRSFGSLLCVGGPCSVNDGRVPARWRILAGSPGECIGQLTNPDMDVSAGQTKTAQCLTFGFLIPFNAAPSAVNLQAPPATFDLNGGSGLSTAYGMPYLEYVDVYTGNIIGSTYATSVAPDGSGLQAAMPDLSGVYSGTYDVLVSNVRSDGGLEYAGTATFDTYGRDGVYEPPPPEPCEPTYGGGGGNPYMEQPIDGGCY